MIKLAAFKKLLEVHHRALRAFDQMPRIQANPVMNQSEKQFWSDGTSTLANDIREEWIGNLYTLPEDLMTRYTKYMYYWGGTFRAWMIDDLERLRGSIDRGNEYYEPIRKGLTTSTWIIDDVIREIERYNEISNIDFNNLSGAADTTEPSEQEVKGNTALRQGELNTEQKVVLTYYLDKFNILSLNKISQDKTAQAIILSSIFGFSFKRTYDRIRRPADLLVVRNLVPVLNVLKQDKSNQWEEIIQQVEKDLKAAS